MTKEELVTRLAEQAHLSKDKSEAVRDCRVMGTAGDAMTKSFGREQHGAQHEPGQTTLTWDYGRFSR